MTVKRWALLLAATHLAALLVGVGAARSDRSARAVEAKVAEGFAKSRTRRERSQRRVSTEDLLAAYTDSNHWVELLQMRNRKDRGEPPGEEEGGETEPFVSPKDRAAMVTDFKAAMDEVLAQFNRGEGGQPWFTKEVIRRWMEADPEACMAWIGAMKTKGGWGDPFSQMFDGELGADPVRAVELMDDKWLQRNRWETLDELGKQAGQRAVDQLPEALRLLGAESERNRLFAAALGVARAEDLAQWLDLMATEAMPSAYSTLAKAILDAENGEALLADVEGTPAEEAFRERWHLLTREWERERLRALLSEDPAAALEGFAALRVEDGAEPAEAPRQAASLVWRLYGDDLQRWHEDALELGLQSVVLGEVAVAELLQERRGAIEEFLPPELRHAAWVKTVEEAILVAPAEVAGILLDRGEEELLRRSMAAHIKPLPNQTTASAEMYREVLELPNSMRIPGIREEARSLAVAMLRDDREGATAWLRTLPGDGLRREIVEYLQGNLRNAGQADVAEQLDREVLGAR